GRDVVSGSGEVGQFRSVPFQVDPLRRGWLPGQTDTWTAFSCWPDRSRNEATAAVRADVQQHGVHALGTERALIATDAGICCSWRQILVAVFAVGSQLQHSRSSDFGWPGGAPSSLAGADHWAA